MALNDYKFQLGADISEASLNKINKQIQSYFSKTKISLGIDSSSIKRAAKEAAEIMGQTQTEIQKRINNAVGGSDILSTESLKKSKVEIANIKAEYRDLFNCIQEAADKEKAIDADRTARMQKWIKEQDTKALAAQKAYDKEQELLIKQEQAEIKAENERYASYLKSAEAAEIAYDKEVAAAQKAADKEYAILSAKWDAEKKQYDNLVERSQKGFAWTTGYDIDDALGINNISKSAQQSFAVLDKYAEKFNKFVDKNINSLQRLKASNKDAFNSPAIQKEYDQLMADLQGMGKTNGKTMDEMSKNMDNFRTHVVKARQEAQNFASTLLKDAGKMLAWTLVGTAIFGTFREIKEGVEIVKQLDKSMTNIQMVMGYTRSEVEGMTREYSALASQLHDTTLSVMQASEEFLRAGKSQSETLALIEASTVMSKIAGEDQKTAADQLIAVTNAYGISAEDAMQVVDKWTTLDNNSAASTQELADAFERTAASAQLAGVSIEELGSYITVVESITKKSSESIGESFKTIFARMQAVSKGDAVDDTGEDISKVETKLNAVGIALRKTDGTFRDLGNVLNDLHSKWNGLNNVQKSEIATQIAGVRQRENFLVLMEHYNDALELQKKEEESAGSALIRYGEYSKSIEAKVNDLTNALQLMWKESINSETIKGIVDFGTKSIKAFSDMGGAATLAKGVIGGLIAYLLIQLPTLAVEIYGVVTAGVTLNTVLGGLPIVVGLLVTAFAGVSYMANQVNAEYQELIDSSNDLVSTYNSAIQSIENTKDQQLGEIETASNLVKQLYDLDAIVNKTALDKAYMSTIVDQLNEIMPDLNLQFNEEAGNLNLTHDALLKNIAALKDYYIIQAKAKEAAQAETSKAKLKENQDDLLVEIENKRKQIEDYKKSVNENQFGFEYISGLGNIKLDNLENQLKELLKVYIDNNMAMDDADKVIKDYNNSVKELSETKKDDSTATVELHKSQKELLADVKQHSSAMKQLESLYKIVTDSKKTDADATQYLMDNYESLAESGVDVEYMLTHISELEQLLPGIYKQEAVARGLAYEQMIGFGKSYLGVTGRQWKSLYTALSGMYGTDLKNFANVAKTKAEIDNLLIKTLGEGWSEYYSSQADALKVSLNKLEAMPNEVQMMDWWKAQYAALKASLGVAEALDDITGGIDIPDFPTGGGTGGGTGQQMSDYLKKLNDQLDIQASNLDKLIDKEKTKLDVIKEEYEKQKAINELLKAEEALRNAKNEKNVRMIVGDQWKYVADPRAVRDAQEKYDELKAEAEQKKKEEAQQKVIDNLESQKKILTDFKAAIGQLSDSVKAQVKTWVQLIAALSKAGIKVVIPKQKFKTGGDVKEDGIVEVHKNEGVLTDEQNKGWKTLVSNLVAPNTLLSSILKFPKYQSSLVNNTSNNNSGTQINIDNMEIVANDPQSFIQEMHNLAILATRTAGGTK